MVALQSFNFSDRFVRHANFLAELTPVRSDLDRNDATFTLVPGLADGRMVSFASHNIAGHFLRHADFRLQIAARPAGDAPDHTLFAQDATFVMGPGFADESGVSFRSLNFPDRFIRHREFHLFLEPITDDVGRADATFLIAPSFVG